jgi:RNA polymerase sigma factor (sigma-70 family)
MEPLEERATLSVLAGLEGPIGPQRAPASALDTGALFADMRDGDVWSARFGSAASIQVAADSPDDVATIRARIAAFSGLGSSGTDDFRLGSGPAVFSEPRREHTGIVRPRGERPASPGTSPPSGLIAPSSAGESAPLPANAPAAQQSAGLRLLTRYDSVSPSVVGNAGGAGGGDASSAVQAGVFRISRTTAGAAKLDVHYTLTAYSRTGAVAGEGVAVIRPGAAHVDVVPALSSLAQTNGHEIATLLLKDHTQYRIAQPAATLLLAESWRGCSEAALLEAYRAGQSKEAFAALVELHRPAIFRTCYGLLGNWLDAEDVSQLVFLVLAQRHVRLQTTLRGWLRRVARNASLGLLRARRRRARHERRAARSPVAVEGDHVALRDELQAALTQLPVRLRDAVRLRYLEGWSQKEAAQLLGCPRGTVSQRAARGIRWLREILGGGAKT